MAVKKGIARLLRLRELEEEQRRLTLESSIRARDRIALEWNEVMDRQALGRKSFVEAIGSLDSAARCGGIMEIEHARKLGEQIAPRLAFAEAETARLRNSFLEGRIAKRQLEALIDQGEIAEREVAARRAQQMLDDWYGRRTQKAFTGPDRN